MFLFFFFHNVKEDTVSKECEDYEIDGGEHAAVNASLRLNAMVHHSVPVLTSQDLSTRGESEWPQAAKSNSFTKRVKDDKN